MLVLDGHGRYRPDETRRILPFETQFDVLGKTFFRQPCTEFQTLRWVFIKFGNIQRNKFVP